MLNVEPESRHRAPTASMVSNSQPQVLKRANCPDSDVATPGIANFIATHSTHLAQPFFWIKRGSASHDV